MRNFPIFDTFSNSASNRFYNKEDKLFKVFRNFEFLEFSESRWSHNKLDLASKDTFAVKRGHFEVIALSRLFRIILFFKVLHSWQIFIARSTGSALELFSATSVRMISYQWFCNTITPKNRFGLILLSTLPSIFVWKRY